MSSVESTVNFDRPPGSPLRSPVSEPRSPSPRSASKTANNAGSSSTDWAATALHQQQDDNASPLSERELGPAISEAGAAAARHDQLETPPAKPNRPRPNESPKLAYICATCDVRQVRVYAPHMSCAECGSRTFWKAQNLGSRRPRQFEAR